MKKAYVDFIRYSLGVESNIPASIGEINWHELYGFAQKQSISGLLAKTILNIDGTITMDDWRGNKPIDDDVLEWMMDYNMLQQLNSAAAEVSEKVSVKFEREGFASCILKGVGNSLYYPTPAMRTSGDVDVWVIPKEQLDKLEREEQLTDRQLLEIQNGCVEKVIAYCRKFVPKSKACYHHIDFLKMKGKDIEVHYRPSWLNNPHNNRELQVYFMRNAYKCFNNKTSIEINGVTSEFCRPTWEFNFVYQLCHVYNHLTHEGIGLRHMVDLYFLLKAAPEDRSDDAYYDTLLNRLGLRKIAEAVMWIMNEIFMLDAKYQICKSNERLGRLLLKEILIGGNFGQYDTRMFTRKTSSQTNNNIKRSMRDLMLLRYFPKETIWEPWFRCKHYFWRQQHR